MPTSIFIVIGLGLAGLGAIGHIVAICLDWRRSPQERAQHQGLLWTTVGAYALFIIGLFLTIVIMSVSDPALAPIILGYLSLVIFLGIWFGEFWLRRRIIQEQKVFQAEVAVKPTLLEMRMPFFIDTFSPLLALYLFFVLNIRALGSWRTQTVLMAIIFVVTIHSRNFHKRWVEQAKKDGTRMRPGEAVEERLEMEG